MRNHLANQHTILIDFRQRRTAHGSNSKDQILYTPCYTGITEMLHFTNKFIQSFYFVKILLLGKYNCSFSKIPLGLSAFLFNGSSVCFQLLHFHHNLQCQSLFQILLPSSNRWVYQASQPSFSSFSSQALVGVTYFTL